MTEEQERVKTETVALADKLAELALSGNCQGVIIITLDREASPHYMSAGLRKTDSLGLLQFSQAWVGRSLFP